MDYEVPYVPGFREHWGNAVFHCPFCHGWEVRDRSLVVYGEGPVAERQARLARAWTDDVTVLAPGEAAGLRRRSRLVEGLGLALTDDGQIETDREGRTSVPGVWAAGDVAVRQQVAIAMGSGHLAGIMAVNELVLGRS